MASNQKHEDHDPPMSSEPGLGLDDIWSSIGPGGLQPNQPPPPTIRPYDPLAKDRPVRSHDRGLPRPGVEPMSMNEPSQDAATQGPRKDPAVDPTDQLRDELRLGVRMIEALENQMQRAERLVKLEEEASESLAARLNTVNSIDTRLEEIEATVATIERRLDRQAAAKQDAGSRSGSLSIDEIHGSDREAGESTRVASSDSGMQDQVRSIRDDLRRELEAICSATSSLAEIVEQADRTERILRGTLENASGLRSDSGSPAWTVSSILRRLAEEFDARSEEAQDASGPATHEDDPALVVEVDATNESVKASSAATFAGRSID